MAGAYVACLVAGVAVRAFRSVPAPTPASEAQAGETAILRAVSGATRLDRAVSVAYRDHRPSGRARSAVVLLHGSPGHVQDFGRLVPALDDHRVIVPDLPGFGRSQRDVPDYSFAAHADYTLQLLDVLDVETAHVVGFSMGGGVAISLADRAPARVASLTLLSGLGVQEMELLGTYEANHLVHGAQLALLSGFRWLLPRFSTRPAHGLTVEYARNFYDSDQRPLRGALTRLSAPTLIVHGTHDALVPYAAALEHHRLVPQSELVTLDDSHFLLFTAQARVAAELTRFFGRVDRGEAPNRGRASDARVRAARAPFDPRELPPAVGVAALVMALLFIAGGWWNVEATAVAGGLLVAQGRIGPVLAFGAAAMGRALADGGWPLLRGRGSRCLGSPAVTPDVAGCLGTSDPAAPAPALDNPTFVDRIGVAARRLAAAVAVGAVAFGIARVAHMRALLPLGLVAAATIGVLSVVLVPLAVRAATPRGRRRLFGLWRRLTRWEFWPAWIVYAPVVVWIAALMARHRSITVFTAANPAIPLGGFVGESKMAILRALETSGLIAPASLVPADLDFAGRMRVVRGLLDRHRLELPVVLKPDQGQRGSGVVIVRSWNQLEACVRQATVDTIVQAFVPGLEFGLFYYRLPGESRGHVFSATEKQLPAVVGDGRRTIEELVLFDDRAAALADLYLSRFGDRRCEIPRAGERVRLGEIGAHCRGAVFVDARDVVSDALVDLVDRVAYAFDGFYFGRFDVKAPSREALASGRDISIIELNGVTSEATHIYDARYGLRHAWAVLREQWRIAFLIGAENRRRGVRAASARELLAAWSAYRKHAAGHLAEAPLGLAPPAMAENLADEQMGEASGAARTSLFDKTAGSHTS